MGRLETIPITRVKLLSFIMKINIDCILDLPCDDFYRKRRVLDIHIHTSKKCQVLQAF